MANNINPLDSRNDKVYASGNVSALGTSRTQCDAVGPPGVTPVLPTTLLAADLSADKYYANGGSNRARIGQQLGAKMPAKGPAKVVTVTGKAAAGCVTDLTIRDVPDVATVLRDAAGRLRARPADPVVVRVANFDLLKRTRTALDMMRTREEITPDAYHNVELQYLPPPPAPVHPTPTPVIELGVADMPPAVPVVVSDVTTAVTPGAVEPPAPEPEEELEDEDDDGVISPLTPHKPEVVSGDAASAPVAEPGAKADRQADRQAKRRQQR